MLDQFTIPHEARIRVQADHLHVTVAAIFEKLGVPSDDAALAADVLVTTDLRGVESHGVSNMLRQYVHRYRTGEMNPRPDWTIERETPGTATIDGDGGHGIIQGPRAMQLAIEKARNVGVGTVVIRNSGHLGAAGYHAMLAAEQDMIGVAMTAAGLHVLPTFGAAPRLGTNPIALAAPARHQPFLLFDVATSAIANNKVRLAERLGTDMEPGWISDAEGTPMMEQHPLPERGTFHLLPLGGTRQLGSHKGYGFGLMVEVLSTLLTGALPMMLDPTSGAKHFLAAWNIAAFTDVEQFKDTMDAMLRTLRETPPAPGEERVLYPGLPEHDAERERRATGIPLHPEVVAWFNAICADLDLPRLQHEAGA